MLDLKKDPCEAFHVTTWGACGRGAFQEFSDGRGNRRCDEATSGVGCGSRRAGLLDPWFRFSVQPYLSLTVAPRQLRPNPLRTFPLACHSAGGFAGPATLR